MELTADNMIEKILFNIMKSNAHTSVRYFIVEKMNGLTFPGEYVELHSNYLTSSCINELLEAGFKIEKINPQKINADAYCDVLFKRNITAQ